METCSSARCIQQNVCNNSLEELQLEQKVLRQHSCINFLHTFFCSAVPPCSASAGRDICRQTGRLAVQARPYCKFAKAVLLQGTAGQEGGNSPAVCLRVCTQVRYSLKYLQNKRGQVEIAKANFAHSKSSQNEIFGSNSEQPI